MSTTTLELRSLMTAEGELRLTLEEAPVAPPGPDEVVIRVDAAPIQGRKLLAAMMAREADTAAPRASATG